MVCDRSRRFGPASREFLRMAATRHQGSRAIYARAIPGDLQTSGNTQHAPNFVSSGAPGGKAIARRYRNDLRMDQDGRGPQLARTDLTQRTQRNNAAHADT